MMSPLLRYFQGQSNFSQCHKIYNILLLRGNEKIVFLIYLSISILLFFFCRLAQRTSTVFANQGVPVYMFSRITPTPFVVSLEITGYSG